MRGMDYDIRIGDLVRPRDPQQFARGLGLVTELDPPGTRAPTVRVVFSSGISEDWGPGGFVESFWIVAPGRPPCP